MGLDYFLARYYSSIQGRFTSVDPDNAGAFQSDPQSWNGYAYARNNPTLYSDPDGRTFKICYKDGGCHDVTDEQFNQIKADAKNLGSVFKNGTIYNEVDGQLVASATYKRTAFDDLSAQANAVIFGSKNGAGLVDRLRPVQQVVEIGFAIDSAIIGGLSTIGSVGGTTLGLATAGSGAAARTTINITAGGLRHVLERHAAGGVRNGGKSVFNAGEDIVGLIRQAESVPAVQQAGRTTFQRVINAGRTIGVDRATGQPTSIYTVITNAAGDLITAFPGVPL